MQGSKCSRDAFVKKCNVAYWEYAPIPGPLVPIMLYYRNTLIKLISFFLMEGYENRIIPRLYPDISNVKNIKRLKASDSPPNRNNTYWWLCIGSVSGGSGP